MEELQKVPGTRWYNEMEFIPLIKKCTLASFVMLRIRSEENIPKNGEIELFSPSRQCSSTPAGFGQGFPSKKQCDYAEESPILSLPVSNRLLPVPSTEIIIEETALL